MGRLVHFSRCLGCALGLVTVLGMFAGSAGAGITIDLVTVGDAGNVGELSGEGSGEGAYGPPRVCGAVPYVYQIGKYEVTNGQYRQFLNSVARYGDPYNLYLYNPEGPGSYHGIARSGSGTVGDPYVYTPKDNDSNWDTRPANYVSWYSSLRFINWLQNGQPVTEAGAGVTETGTYAFSDPSTVSIPDHSGLTTPTWVLPTEDEWYKAAYYKAGGTAAGYWDYATQTDLLPNNNPPELDTGNSANYTFVDLVDPNNSGYAVGPPYYMTDVGAYGLSESAYGTYDQDGDVAEMVETFWDIDSVVLRGSSWAAYQFSMPGYARTSSAGTWQVVADTGFRVALVPEPSSVGLALVGALVVGLCRRSRAQ